MTMIWRESWSASSVHASKNETQMDRMGEKTSVKSFSESYRLVYLIRDDAIEVLTVFEGHRLLETDAGTELP